MEYRREYEQGHIKHIDFREAKSVSDAIRINQCRIPVRPMLGMMGTAPSEGVYRTGPPREFGGNMDLKLLGPGATVHLPVFVEGALFSFGDGHAVQGDGELCTTGVETAMEAKLTFAVQKGVSIKGPHVETSATYAIVAAGKSLDDASKTALEHALDWLVHEHQFEFWDAYMLLGIAADLRICQVVNYPSLGVRIEIPKDIYNASIWNTNKTDFGSS
jgi:amidase